MADLLGFRVCVDAREVCKDIKSRFFIYVDLLRDRYIHDIESRVKSYLRVDKPISLMVGSIYVPPSENVRLLCPDDVLK
jgi:ABC-type ATPase with predicted acetyltransferase domain